MEYVAGATLLDHVDSDGVLPLPFVASLGALLAEGLAAVHEAGLLHRDLKPQNIILGADGPMIIDFRLAALVDASQDSLSHQGMILGTVRCMPPEQAGGNPRVTPAADVYALGTVLLCAAASHYPYDGLQWQAIAAQVTNPQLAPDLSEVPAALVPLIESMLAYEPQDRPTVTDVAAGCAGLLGDAGLTPADARLALVARTAGRNPAAIEHRLSPSIEARLAELLTSSDDIDRSLLDGPPPAPVDETAQSQDSDRKPSLSDLREPERTVAVETSAPSSDHAPIPRRRPGRPPASSRLADELRRHLFDYEPEVTPGDAIFVGCHPAAETTSREAHFIDTQLKRQRGRVRLAHPRFDIRFTEFRDPAALTDDEILDPLASLVRTAVTVSAMAIIHRLPTNATNRDARIHIRRHHRFLSQF